MSPLRAVLERLLRDPRHYQIAALAGLLAWGVLRLRFDIAAPQIAATLGAALAAQWACTKAWREPRFEPRSALISALSLCLLLRTNHLALAALAAAMAVASKFAIRVRGKHVFNPTNGALAVLLILHAPVWVSAGQWGNTALFCFAIAGVGLLVVNRAARSDVTLGFLAAYALILFARALWLGQRLAVPLHQLTSGALLLFAFFMISDPRTTPDSRAGRLVFAVLVAAGAAFVPFVLYRTNGLLWSLAVGSLLVPLIDRLLPGARYDWSARSTPLRPAKGRPHETPALAPAALRPVPVRVAARGA